MWKTIRRQCPTTVLHLVHSVEHGGTERLLCRILSRLAADSDMRHIVCTQREAGPRCGELSGVADVVSLGAGAHNRLAFARLAKLIRTANVGIVHARNLGTWADAVLACVMARQGEPVLGFHGLQSGATITARQGLRGRVLRVRKRLMTAVSVSARDQLVSQLGCSPSRVTVLSNGVDVNRFSPPAADRCGRARAELGLTRDDFAVGMVANFVSPVKGHAVLLDAASRLVRSHPRMKIVFVGLGPSEMSVREESRRLGLDDHVVFAGGREDVALLMAAFDAYVCPSLSEGMSNALLEAMACARPCVVTDVADHKRMFAEIDPAAVVPAGDAEALAVAIAALMDDRDRQAVSGLRARELVVRSFDFERTVAAYRQFYLELLGRITGQTRRTAAIRDCDAIAAVGA